MRLPFAIILLLLLTGAAPDLAGLEFTPHPGAQVPLDDPFKDATGPVTLRQVMEGRPAVLALGYFACPNLCGVVRSDLFAALSGSGLDPHRDVAVVALSVDPHETTADAARAQRAEDYQGARFLSGDAGPVAQAVGFPFRTDAKLAQILHPAGLVVLTPRGVVSGYLLGVGYTAGALRSAIERAAVSGIEPSPANILLLCFHYDQTTGRYSLDIFRAVQVAGILTVLAIGGWLLLIHSARRR